MATTTVKPKIFPTPMAEKEKPIPPLQMGDLLSRAEFERRYLAHPEVKKAELLEGIVYMPSPVNAEKHGTPHFRAITWLGMYAAMTPGLEGSDNATLRLDNENEPQPDAMLRLDQSLGGHSWIDRDGYVQGAPELAVEIAASSASYDMHQKRRVYARSGIQEYLVLLAFERQVVWFTLREGVYTEMPADEKGILRSEVFPGLWLDGIAFWAGEMGQVLTVLQTGMAAAEYVDFVAALTVPPGKGDPT